MSAVVERAAAAMFLVDYPRDDWDRLGAGGFHQTRYCNMVRAAIISLRDPSDEMIEAENHMRLNGYTGRDTWQAMIDAALAAPPSGGAA